jgi:cobalamin biosynthesis protein CbiG
MSASEPVWTEPVIVTVQFSPNELVWLRKLLEASQENARSLREVLANQGIKSTAINDCLTLQISRSEHFLIRLKKLSTSSYEDE